MLNKGTPLQQDDSYCAVAECMFDVQQKSVAQNVPGDLPIPVALLWTKDGDALLSP